MVHQVLVELLFENWWLPSLILPSENAITTHSVQDSAFHGSMLSIIRILKAALYHRPISDGSPFASLVDKFIEDKKESIRKYLKELLAVKYEGSVEDKEAGLVIVSVCMSIESVNFVVAKLNKKVEELAKVSSNCVSYLAQINNYFVQNSAKEFAIDDKLFKPLYSPESALQDFKEGKHYILLQDIYLKERAQSVVLSSEFETYLHKLLISIDLSSYYSTIGLQNSVDDFIKLLKHVAKYPEHFFVTSDKHCKVQLLANKLLELFSRGEVTVEMVNELAGDCVKKVAALKERNCNVENMLRMNAMALKARLDYLTVRKKFTAEKLLPSIFAKKIIFNDPIPFEIVLDGTNSEDAEGLEYIYLYKIEQGNTP
eukprot:TRINITY_DN872_c0_g4_i1.p1 TRINITY_DN872_c0_g4~~TRINITY_DN872_c0_g4_i1.p1  ORF type:complete len:371 (+),score=128.53 TRINITY_DN872_c0_g4_i1:1347-2459(+)